MVAIVLRGGGYEAVFRPDVAMLCTSFTHRGMEHLARPRPIARFRAGETTALPLLHPWANRLGGRAYAAGGVRVDLRRLDLPTDEAGLPIHGNLLGAPFVVEHVDRARVVASLDYGTRPDLLRAFPFPHVLTVDARVDAAEGLRVTTAVRATGRRPVPISFGWHPYLRLPGSRRREWVLNVPPCEQLRLDARRLPTGERTRQPATRRRLGEETLDDLFVLGGDRTFVLRAPDHELQLTFDDHYPFVQLYAPPRRQFVAVEPMTAPIDALRRAATPMCAPGDVFRATFAMRVTR
jgi:galactose mutarotase-like enzyme